MSKHINQSIHRRIGAQKQSKKVTGSLQGALGKDFRHINSNDLNLPAKLQKKNPTNLPLFLFTSYYFNPCSHQKQSTGNSDIEFWGSTGNCVYEHNYVQHLVDPEMQALAGGRG